MPKVFHVRWSAELELSIIAESADEARKSCVAVPDKELSDWLSEVGNWDIAMSPEGHDPATHEPDMGVVNGQLVAMTDYKKAHPASTATADVPTGNDTQTTPLTGIE